MRFKTYLDLIEGGLSAAGQVTSNPQPRGLAILNTRRYAPPEVQSQAPPPPAAVPDWWKKTREVYNRLNQATQARRPGQGPTPLIKFYTNLSNITNRQRMTRWDVEQLASRTGVDPSLI